MVEKLCHFYISFPKKSQNCAEGRGSLKLSISIWTYIKNGKKKIGQHQSQSLFSSAFGVQKEFGSKNFLVQNDFGSNKNTKRAEGRGEKARLL